MVLAALRQARAQRQRLVGVLLALALGVGFLSLTFMFGSVVHQGMRNSVGAEYRHLDLAIESATQPIPEETLDAVASLPGVADVQPMTVAWLELRRDTFGNGIFAISLPDSGVLRDSIPLTEGRLPEQPGEIVLSTDAARRLRADVGDRVTVDSTGQAFTIVALWSGEERIGDSAYDAILHTADFNAVASPAELWGAYVIFDPDADASSTASQVAQVVGPTVTVTPRDALVDRALENRKDMVEVQNRGVQGFGVLALLVAGIVVSNTMAILIAQRRRDIALLRCAGALAGQVRGMVLTEAIAVGVVASIVGLAGATISANIGLRVLHQFIDAPYLPTATLPSLGTVAVAVLAGCTVSLLAAWIPARTATRIDPLQALRSANFADDERDSVTMLRVGMALLLFAGGGMLLTLGMILSYRDNRLPALAIGMLGGLVSFAGVMLGAAIVVPLLAAAFGRVASRFGVPAAIAASNGMRNPRRLTATTMALVIGVSLVTMMLVGAESLKATLSNQVDAETPWDIAVTVPDNGSGASLDALIPALRDTDGVADLATSSTANAVLAVPGGSDAETWSARAVDPADLTQVWRDQQVLDRFVPGTVLIPLATVSYLGVEDGATLSVEIDGTKRDLRVIAYGEIVEVLVARADFPGVTTAVNGAWIRLADDANGDDIASELYALADAAGSPVNVEVISSYRESLTRALDALLAAVTAMLMVAVAIAVIGVGNTLTLSVIERTRESALLRALGMTRGQLRQSLAIEGGLLALLGTAIGVALGTLFGWAAAITLIGNTFPLELGFPVLRVGLMVIVAIGCGLLASVLPARRAARVDPVVALAAV